MLCPGNSRDDRSVPGTVIGHAVALKSLLLAGAELPHAGAPHGVRDDAASNAPVRAAIPSDEQALIARCRAGDRAALRSLYEQYHRRVYSLTQRIAGPQDAEELTQEVFLKAFRGLANFRGDAQLGTWIYRLAVNAALSHVTRSRSKYHLPEEVLGEMPAPAAPDGDPRMRQRLEAALAKLPPGYRAVLVLHDVEGLEHEEVASVLGCSVGTSKSQLHKARARMRELLGPALAAERARRPGGSGDSGGSGSSGEES
jgi:RNA polymerase sigma-70 factor (ECF subfamily)